MKVFYSILQFKRKAEFPLQNKKSKQNFVFQEEQMNKVHRFSIINALLNQNDSKHQQNAMSQTKTIDLMKKHVLSYCKQDDKKAWLALACSLAYEIAAITLINLDQTFLGWLVHTLVTVRLFVQFHDMAHYSFFSSMTMNKYIGKILGVYVHFPFESWRKGHNHHHKHFGNLDRLDLSQTILFTKKQYEAMTPMFRMLVRFFRQPIVFFLISAPFIWFVGLFFSIGKREGIFSFSFLQKVLAVVIYTFICPMLGIPALGMWISVYGTNIIGTILFHLQHSVNLPYRQRGNTWDFVKAAIEGSTFVKIPILFKPFTNGIEYHHIHHLNTMVPSYMIEECHHSFEGEQDPEKGTNWDQIGINQVGLGLAFKSVFNVMLDEETSTLRPFDYGWK